MNTVILCEKPDMALNIAKALGDFEKKSGYIQTNDYKITWAYGHIVSLAPPLSYLSKDRIEKQDLPIIPEQFRLQVIPDKETQFMVIRNLFQKADKLINATDAGREGELIFRYIYTKSNCNKPFDRLWLKSLTKKGILQGFENILSGSDKDTLYYSAKARSQADWLVGLNASIAFSYQANIGRALSLGRVQTPTLKMIVDRFLEVRNFQKKAVFSPFITIDPKSEITKELSIGYCKSFDKTPGEAFFENYGDKVFCIEAQEKERKEKAPLPFDLPALQQKASQLFKYSAKNTATLMQSLYERHKVLTYPRTDSRYITKDVYEEIPEILKSLKLYTGFEKHIDPLLNSELPKGCVNDDKVTDHHAIIPTGVIPEGLTKDEENIFNLVFSQFLAALYPSCIKSVTTYALARHKEMSLDSQDYFSVSGTVIKKQGWRAVLGNGAKDVILPVLLKEQSYTLVNKGIQKSFTKPKSYFTDGTLIAAMTGCGKEFDTNYDIPKDVKANGIGRQGTRDQIIETLLHRNYIIRNKNFLLPTNFGMETAQALKESMITSVQLTGEWENSLEKIVNKELDYQTFMQEVENFTNSIVNEIGKLKVVFSEDKYNCPKCKQKTLVNRKPFFTCQSEGCDFRLWKKIADKVVPDTILIELLTLGQTKKIIKGFKKYESESTFDAALKLGPEGKLNYIFPNTSILKKEYTCPKCKKGTIKENSKSVFCSEYQNGCDFSIWKKTYGKKLSEKHIDTLLNNKQTPVINGFISKTKVKYNASLRLDDQYKVVLVFPK